MTKVITQESAGGVIYRENEGEMWVGLIATKGRKTWGLPKGLIEKGEDPLEAALREVAEEAGLRGLPIAYLGRIEYWYRDSESKVLHHKFVQYYLLEWGGGDVADHGWEVDEARWFRIDEALEIVSCENEREVLSSAREQWREHRSEDA